MARRPHLIPAVVIAFLLLIGPFPLPYGYYVFLRWVTCSMAGFTAYIAYQWEAKWAIWIFILIAILFNPVIPVHLTKEIWPFVDIICATIFGIGAFTLKKPQNG